MARIVNEGFPIKEANGIKINTSILSDSRNYYSYASGNKKYVVMHYTGNTSDTALANARYFSTGSRSASAQYFVDDNDIYQSVALNNAAWAVGGTKVYKHSDCRNINSISIEMCCSGNYTISGKTEINAAYLCAELCKYLNISANEVDIFVLRHYDVWDKQCPAGWTGSNNARWTAFKGRVKSILNGTTRQTEEEINMTQYKELKNENMELKEKISKLEEKFISLTPMVYDYIDENMPDWARPTIQKLVGRGILNGDENGRLGLTGSDLKQFVVNDRAGLYG